MASRFLDGHTRVFWDVEDFPFPEGRDIRSFRYTVKQALERVGVLGDLSIHAYSGSKTCQRSEAYRYQTANMVLVLQRRGYKRFRVNRMLLDMIEWAFENALTPERTNFVVIAKDFGEGISEYKSVVESLAERRYNVFLAVSDTFKAEDWPHPSIATLVWRWTSLFDGNMPFRIAAEHLPFKIPDFDSDSDSESDMEEDCEEGNLLSQGAEKRVKRSDEYFVCL